MKQKSPALWIWVQSTVLYGGLAFSVGPVFSQETNPTISNNPHELSGGGANIDFIWPESASIELAGPESFKPKYFNFTDDKHQLVVAFHFDGTIEIGPGFKESEAAWKFIQQVRRQWPKLCEEDKK